VLFFLELQERAGESPTAALGALDLLDKLAPQPSRAQEEKCALAVAAMRSIKGLPPGEALELLYLLCRRLQEHSFAPGQSLQVEIRNLVQQTIRDDPEQGITDANSLTARHAETAPTLFVLGVGDAIMELLGSKPATASLLLEQPRLMERLIPYRPEIASTMLKSPGAVDREQVISSIVDWCRAEQVSGVRPALRRSLLPEVMKPGDAPLVEELLRDLRTEEVAEVCDLVESRDAFRSGPLSDLVGRLVGERQPSSVREWSRTHSWSSYQAATVIAASYPPTADGLNELFGIEVSESTNESLLLAAFIERASAFSLPGWLHSLLTANLRFWELLLAGINDQAVGNVVVKLVRGGLKRSPIARVPDAARMLGGMSAKDPNAVKEHAIRQLLADYLEASCDIRKVKLWFGESWVVEALTRIRADSVRAIFTDQLESSLSSWQRAWNIVENIPDAVALENEDLVQEIISVLLQIHPDQWTVAAADSWQHLLSKISWGDRVLIDLCAQALHFAFEHRRYPLAGVVAETFYPVHEAAMKHQPNRGPWFLWGFGTWDKAKDLRRSLVDSFLCSDWPPSHFALSAREPWLLRKLCTRMSRQWKGSEYLESAYIGLNKLPSPKAQELAGILHQIVQNPELSEEWD
jgi:hypothetical protein